MNSNFIQLYAMHPEHLPDACRDFNHSANSSIAIEERAEAIRRGEPSPYRDSPHLVDSFIERAAQRHVARQDARRLDLNTAHLSLPIEQLLPNEGPQAWDFWTQPGYKPAPPPERDFLGYEI